ncbi:peptide MFS transporter [Roseivirga sp. BDSF3-8]|uniref:peptide MFS transporter n=1 Tax=Roseivirga sp. BDSF3-8 TaxID=3241598 RepID=UPI003531AFAD
MSKRDTVNLPDNSDIERSTIGGHPKGLMILFFTEMWERFSYYGMRGILVLFLVSTVNGGFGWTESGALELYGWYTMLVYLVSVPGGWLADNIFGQKKAVLIGGFTLVAGHFLMAVPLEWAFYGALLLIVAGTGLLKPNISTMVGGLYKKGDNRRDAGFTIFYMGINLGAFLAAIIVGYVGETIGWHYGFSLAGFGMLLGQIVFIAGQKHLKGVGDLNDAKSRKESLAKNPNGTSKSLTGNEKDRLVLLGISFVIVLVFWAAFEQAGGLMNLYTKNYTDRYIGQELTVNEYRTAGTSADDSLAIAQAKYFIENKQVTEYDGLGEFFGNLFNPTSRNFSEIQTQLGATDSINSSLLSYDSYVIQHEGADGTVYNSVMDETAPIVKDGNSYVIYDLANDLQGFIVPASWFQSLNALFILIFGGIIASLWVFLARRGKNPPSIFKMGLGTAVMGAGFIFMVFAALQRGAAADGMSAMYWLVLAYLFHTLGELALSPVALSYITKLAPARMVASVMGVYFAVTGLGNKLAGALGEWAQSLGELQIFGGIAVTTIALGLLLMLFSKRLNKLSHGAEDASLDEDDAERVEEAQLTDAEIRP